MGLLSTAHDLFRKSYFDEDVEYKNNIRDKIHVVDAGLVIGAGYRIKTKYGMNVGLQYYYGLVPLLKGDDSPTQYNRSLYLTAGLPIGRAKAAKRAAEKKALEEGTTLPKN